MSPSKKLNNNGITNSISGTAQKDASTNNNTNTGGGGGNSGQVERISVTIPTNPLLMPNASV